MTDDVFASGARFVLTEGRLVERRLFATLFEGAPAAGVADALRGYRNPDGGFGHALEPDARCPLSLPIYTEVAFQTLADARAADHSAAGDDLLGPACDWLASIAEPDGSVPLGLPVVEDYPRAEHWTDWMFQPGANPTAGLAGRLHRLGFEHPWRDAATAYTWDLLDRGDLPGEVHAIAELLVFLEHVPDRDRADRHAAAVVEHTAGLEHWHADPDGEGYGLTPLTFAPRADSRWRSLFDEKHLDGHLDRLLADQQPDGGWPIAWNPPSDASRSDWRGMVTVGALQTLTSYGRVNPAAG